MIVIKILKYSELSVNKLGALVKEWKKIYFAIYLISQKVFIWKGALDISFIGIKNCRATSNSKSSKKNTLNQNNNNKSLVWITVEVKSEL